MNVTNKDIADKQKTLGQYLTPKEVAQFCLDKTSIYYSQVVEPSCGTGVFLDLLKEKCPNAQIQGWELDTGLLDQYTGNVLVRPRNFYNVEDVFTVPVHFIGNPPYRSPAYSLISNKDYVTKLRDKYHVKGMREEAVLFLIKTVDLIKSNGVDGWISYILPKAIFKNNSKAFTAFINFLRKHLCLEEVWDLGNVFEGVMRDLVYVQFSTKLFLPQFLLNGEIANVDDFYGVGSDIIPFQKIFKKTYLGSVPCESIFLSCRGESREDFQRRLVRLFSGDVNAGNLVDFLSYNGKPHLKALQRKDPNKIEVVLGYVEQTKTLPEYDISLFENIKNYKSIAHREEDRWYFRHEFLKKAPFVYQINPNPCPSFTFPGNPSSTSGDYFRYCEYDMNRNSGPGANRTVPTDGVELNLTDEFKAYWDENARLPYVNVFEYLLHIFKSQWYHDFKVQNQRFYFGVPKQFDKTFLERG